jgi:general secretion pathway protein J
MTPPAASSGDAGFTLVEALLATLLMSLIMAALATVTAQWMPSWDRGVERLQRVEAVGLGLDRLAADLAAAEFVSAGPGIGPGSGVTVDAPIFDGGALSVIFVRTTLSPNGSTGLEVVRIAETSDDRGPVLVRSTAPFSPNVAGTGSADGLLYSNAVAVIRAPYRVTFSYAGIDRVWRDTWHGQTELPRAVRIRLRDILTSTTLAVSTSTLIHAELPVHCTWAKSISECPALARQSSSAGNEAGNLLGSQ